MPITNMINENFVKKTREKVKCATDMINITEININNNPPF